MPPLELDDLDRKIIRKLQYDGRAPFTQVAEELGISEGTVRNRVNRLTDAGVMQVVAIVQPQFLGWDAAALIGLNIQHDRVEAVAHEIARFPEVSYLLMASGGYDLFAEVYCQDMAHLVTFLNHKLRQVPGIQRTETFMILKMYKLSYRWGEAQEEREDVKS